MRRLLYAAVLPLPAAVLGLPVLLLLAGCATTVAPSGGASVSADLLELPVFQRDTPAKQVQARQLFIRGLTRAYLNLHEDAIQLYEEALRLVPAEPAILSALAASYHALDQTSTALFYAQQAREHAPENVYYHQHLAELHLHVGDVEQAARTYEALLARFPRNADALHDLARLQTAGGQYREALTTYTRLLDVVGEDAELQHQMLQLYRWAEDEDGMVRLLERMIEADPGNHDLRRMLGARYAAQGKLQQATALLEAGMEQRSDDLETALALADLYRRLGAHEKAEQLLERSIHAEGASPAQLVTRAAALYARADADPEAGRAATRLLRRALQLNPEHEEALTMLGRLQFSARAYAEAADLLYRALQQNPRNPELWFQAAAAHYQAGDAGRAVEVADEGLLLFPGRFDLLRLAAYGLMETYQNEAALARFEEALHILQEEPDARQQADLLAGLALLHDREKNPAASDSLYALAIAADPEHALALNNFAYSLAARETRLSEALGFARRAVALEPDNPSFLDTLGWICFKQGNLQEARKWLGKAVETGRASATVLEHYGHVLTRLGRHDEARRVWQQALEMNPNNRALQDRLEPRR